MSQDWQKILIHPEDSIEDVIRIIDKEALRLALVTDNEGLLVGVVTDGDVRRGLLKHIPLSAPVKEIMNPSPKVARENEDRNQILQTMQKFEILAIPVVNHSGKVVDLHTLVSLLRKPERENPVFLMAGGFGTRLRPLTDNCPKPLLPVGGRPILETILEGFVQSGFRNFYISTHYLSEMIMEHFGDGSKWGVNITYIHEEIPLGTGGALGLLSPDIPQLPLIMMNGDILTKVDLEGLLQFHTQEQACATMCVRQYEYQVPYGVVDHKGHFIERIIEKPEYKFFVNAGIYVLDPSIIKSVPKGEYLDMPSLLQNIINADRNVAMYPLHEYWLDIGKMPDFQKAQIDFHEDF